MYENNFLKLDSGIPLYYQIKEIISQRIIDGYYKPGSVLPSEETLAKDFNVSQGTIRRAMSDLVNNGFLYRRSGLGTIVRNEKIEYSFLKSYGFSRILKETGLVPSTKVLKFEVIDAGSADVSRSLELADDDKVYSIVRVKFANEEPLYLEHFYLIYKNFEKLSIDDLNKDSLYDLLREKFNISYGVGKQFLEPIIIDKYEAEILGIPKGSPAMMLNGIVYSTDKIPLLYFKDIIRGDKCKYYFESMVKI